MEEIIVKKTPEHGGTYLSRAEQETIVTVGALDKTADVCSNDPVYWRRLDAMCEKHPNEYHLKRVHKDADGLILCKWYSVPRRLVRFAPPVTMSEEQRKAASERLKKAREAKSGV